MARKKSRKRDEADAIENEGEERKSLSRSQERRLRASKTSQIGVAPKADSDGLKYRLTFLSDQWFRGQFHKEGEQIEVPYGIFNAYKGRSALKFEQL